MDNQQEQPKPKPAKQTRICEHCGKPLRAIGLDRANGKPGRKNNARLKGLSLKSASKGIPANREIFTGYGSAYWVNR